MKRLKRSEHAVNILITKELPRRLLQSFMPHFVPQYRDSYKFLTYKQSLKNEDTPNVIQCSIKLLSKIDYLFNQNRAVRSHIIHDGERSLFTRSVWWFRSYSDGINQGLWVLLADIREQLQDKSSDICSLGMNTSNKLESGGKVQVEDLHRII